MYSCRLAVSLVLILGLSNDDRILCLNFRFSSYSCLPFSSCPGQKGFLYCVVFNAGLHNITFMEHEFP